MSYLLNKTDGTILTELIDGRIDTQSTNLTLVGRNYNGFGEAFNENFIRLLENFSNSSAPSNPLEGQTWWDKTDRRLKVYNGAQWKAAGGPFVQETRPEMVAGDLWIDNVRKQLFAYDGQTLILVGPGYSAEQGLSGFQVENILDTQARSKTVIKLYLNEKVAAVISNEEFVPINSNPIVELVTETNPEGRIFKGFNVVGKTDQEAEDGLSFRFIGIAESTDTLVTPDTGEFKNANQFLPSDRPGVTTGSLDIRNPDGLRISTSESEVYNIQRIQDQKFYIENQIRDYDLSIRVRSSEYGANLVDAIYIDAANGHVGIFNQGRVPEYTLDVAGDLRVEGNLRVEGETISVQSTTLQIQDKNIELATSEGEAAGDDTVADQGGIELRSTDGDKTILWFNSTKNWTSNQSFNLSNPSSTYNIADSAKVTTDSLTNIFYAPDLLEIGQLNFLDVDNVRIDGNTVSAQGGLIWSSDSGMNISLNNHIVITNPVKITGLADPTDNSDVTNKRYVDEQNRVEQIALTLDITGMGTGATLENNIRAFLSDLYPVNTTYEGKIARLHTYTYSGTLINLDSVKDISFVAVRNENDNGPESVVQDIAFDSIPYPPPNRALYTFEVQNGVWTRIAVQSYS